MSFVVFRMRSWDILINCFKRTEDLLQSKKRLKDSDIYL